MLKLFKNPAQHIGQKVVYWTGQLSDMPVECIVVSLSAHKEIMSPVVIMESSCDIRELRSVPDCHACCYVEVTRVVLKPCDEGDFIYTGPEKCYVNWVEWREASRGLMRLCRSDAPALSESFKRLEGACRDFIGMLDSGSDFSSGEKDRMNAVLCSLFVGVQNDIAASNGSTCVQKLWSRLEAKRERQERSRKIRDEWNNRNMEELNAVQGE